MGANGRRFVALGRAVGLLLWLLFAQAAAAQSFRWHAPITPYVLPGFSHGVFGDINQDGRLDLITTNVSNWGQVAVSLQREDGNFDFPISHRCDCAPGRIRLLKRSDGWPLIYFEHSVDPYAFPDLSRYGVGFLELRQDYTLAVIRHDAGTIDEFGQVDVNQDGNDDLYATYFDYRDNLQFRYRIWFAGISSNADRLLPAPSSRLEFAPYESEPFSYEGITDLRYNYTYIKATDVDINADGYRDHMEGLCPGECLFRQQPYRQLAATSTTSTPDLSNYGGDSTFGDLDGDGLADRVHTFSGSYGEDMRLYLQTAPQHFEQFASYGPLYAPSNVIVRDVDNNGLADMVVQSEYYTLSETGWLDTILQTSPGQFEVVAKRIGNATMGSRLDAMDYDGDGCADLAVRERIGGSLGLGFRLWRGAGCQPPTDFAVGVDGTPEAPRVHATLVRGSAATEPRILRVTLAPAVRDADAVGYHVSAPANCAGVAAEAPRRMYDCVLPAMSVVGDRVEYSFAVGIAPGFEVDTQVTAFLLDHAGDSDPNNNRAQLLRTMDTRTTAGQATPAHR